jgi:uncharacterized membrane protein YbhN (UPF0104 family)
MRQWLSLLARITISAALLYYAFSSVNTAAIGARLQDLRISWLVAAVAVAFVQLTLLAVRWQAIVHACGAAVEFGRSFRLILISTFFNQVLPSAVGGDAVRIWLFARTDAGWAKSTHSVLLDRFVGVLSLALVSVACLPWSLVLIRNPIGRTALLAIGIGSIGGALSFIALGYLKWNWLQSWLPLRHLMQMAVTARKILFSTSGGGVIALSILINLLTAGMAWCAAQAIAAPLSYFQALLLVPPVMLIATVPISVAGWGVREKSLVLAFAYAGLPEGDGFLISVLLGVTLLAAGIPGGIAWLTDSDRSKSVASEKAV